MQRLVWIASSLPGKRVFYYVCNYVVGHYMCVLSMSTCKCVCDYMCIHIWLLICARYMNDNTIYNNPRAHGQILGSCRPPLSIMKWAQSLCNYVGTWHYTGGDGRVVVEFTVSDRISPSPNHFKSTFDSIHPDRVNPLDYGVKRVVHSTHDYIYTRSHLNVDPLAGVGSVYLCMYTGQ